MGTFECLPREIWEIILFYGGDSVKKGRVMAVNKHWYNMFLSITFTAPFIRLSCDHSKYHDIINSPFRPGQWITSITFRFFKAETEYTTDVTQSKLYRLMMHTPYVEEINFDQIKIVDAQDWDYFYKVLETANVWKLRRLPDNWDLESIDNRVDMKSVYSTYLKCAQHLKGSLSSFNLMKEIMPTYVVISFLNGFTVLTSLNITQGLLENIYDLDILLQHTPQLKELEVDLKDTNFGSDDHSEIAILNGVYPRIKRLTFHHFKFETDSQVSVFYTNFTGLQKLHLACVESQILLKPETVKSFFTKLASLSDYNVSFQRNIIHVSKFINENCHQEMDATVIGSHPYDESIHISKTKFSPRTMIKYNFYTKQNNGHEAAKCILSDLGQNIRQLELRDLEDEFIQQDYLEALLGTKHKNLRSIIFKDIIFESLSMTDVFYPFFYHHITFDGCRFSNQALQSLSSRFKRIDAVFFKGCGFDESFEHDWVNIFMPWTNIGHLYISYNAPFSPSYNNEMETRWDDDEVIENPRVFPLACITLIEEEETGYYYTRDEEKPVIVETTETQFFLLAQGYPYLPFIKVIHVYVPLVRKICLQLSNDRSKDITMVFY